MASQRHQSHNFGCRRRLEDRELANPHPEDAVTFLRINLQWRVDGVGCYCLRIEDPEEHVLNVAA